MTLAQFNALNIFFFTGEANLCGACLPNETCTRDPLIGQYRCMCEPCQDQDEKEVVCGDDDREYENVCKMNLAACKQKKSIAVQHIGHCGEFFILRHLLWLSWQSSCFQHPVCSSHQVICKIDTEHVFTFNC